jgi:hypothetical protein
VGDGRRRCESGCCARLVDTVPRTLFATWPKKRKAEIGSEVGSEIGRTITRRPALVPVPVDHPSEGQLRPSATLARLGQDAAVSEYRQDP